MSRAFDTIIVGAGSVGMAAGYYLAEQGKKVLLIDEHNPPHSFGSHHGYTRIFRMAYGDCKSTPEAARRQPYIPLALEAAELWRELEQLSGNTLFFPSGLLDVGYASSDRLKGVIETASAYTIPLEVLNATEIRRRWPQLAVPTNFIGCLETSSGILLSEICIETYKALALHHGAELRTHCPVKQISIGKDSVEVSTGGDVFQAQTLLVCAGGWTEKLLPELSLQFHHIRKTTALFEDESRQFDYRSFPALFYDLGDQSYYALPSVGGSGLKVGRHDGGRSFEIGEPMMAYGTCMEDQGEIDQFISAHFASRPGSLIEGSVCQYTLTADEDFIVDFHPRHRHVMIAAGLGGHGFKFASVLGKKLSRMALSQEQDEDLAIFSLQRPALSIDKAPAN